MARLRGKRGPSWVDHPANLAVRRWAAGSAAPVPVFVKETEKWMMVTARRSLGRVGCLGSRTGGTEKSFRRTRTDSTAERRRAIFLRTGKSQEKKEGCGCCLHCGCWCHPVREGCKARLGVTRRLVMTGQRSKGTWRARERHFAASVQARGTDSRSYLRERGSGRSALPPLS